MNRIIEVRNYLDQFDFHSSNYASYIHGNDLFDQLLYAATNKLPGSGCTYYLDEVYIGDMVYPNTSLGGPEYRSSMCAQLKIPEPEQTTDVATTTPFYMRIGSGWTGPLGNPDTQWFYVKGLVETYRNKTDVILRINDYRIDELELMNRVSIRHYQEKVMNFNNEVTIINMHDIMQYREHLTAELADHCTAKERELFDNYVPEFMRIIADAVRNNLSKNQYIVHIPRPISREWEDVNMDMWLLYMWNYKLNNVRTQVGETSLNYDPVIDTLVFKFYLNDAVFRVTN